MEGANRDSGGADHKQPESDDEPAATQGNKRKGEKRGAANSDKGTFGPDETVYFLRSAMPVFLERTKEDARPEKKARAWEKVRTIMVTNGFPKRELKEYSQKYANLSSRFKKVKEQHKPRSSFRFWDEMSALAVGNHSIHPVAVVSTANPATVASALGVAKRGPNPPQSDDGDSDADLRASGPIATAPTSSSSSDEGSAAPGTNAKPSLVPPAASAPAVTVPDNVRSPIPVTQKRKRDGAAAMDTIANSITGMSSVLQSFASPPSRGNPSQSQASSVPQTTLPLGWMEDPEYQAALVQIKELYSDCSEADKAVLRNALMTMCTQRTAASIVAVIKVAKQCELDSEETIDMLRGVSVPTIRK